MTQIDRTIAKGQLVVLTFMQDNVAADQTDEPLTLTQVNAGAGIGVDGYLMPFAGEVIAISASVSAAASAGALTVKAAVNGTDKPEPALMLTDNVSGAERTIRGRTPFAAGDVIGVELTTNGSWNATTSDLCVTVWVFQYLDGI